MPQVRFFGSFQIHQPFFETFSCETFRLVKQIEEPEYHAVRHFLSRLPLSHFHSNRVFLFPKFATTFFPWSFVDFFFLKSDIFPTRNFLFVFFFCVLPCVTSSPKKTQQRSRSSAERSGSAAWSSCFQSARSFDARLSQSEDVYEALAPTKKRRKFLEDFASTKWQGENWGPVFFF